MVGHQGTKLVTDTLIELNHVNENTILHSDLRQLIHRNDIVS